MISVLSSSLYYPHLIQISVIFIFSFNSTYNCCHSPFQPNLTEMQQNYCTCKLSRMILLTLSSFDFFFFYSTPYSFIFFEFSFSFCIHFSVIDVKSYIYSSASILQFTFTLILINIYLLAFLCIKINHLLYCVD